MSIITELGAKSPESLIEEEIQSAKQDVRPISRRSLANMLVREKGLTLSEANEVVDAYCDEKAPYTPDYLSKEFMLPYLKVLSMFAVILSLVLLGYAVRLQLANKLNWPLYVGGAILFLLSGIGLLRILAVEREN